MERRSFLTALLAPLFTSIPAFGEDRAPSAPDGLYIQNGDLCYDGELIDTDAVMAECDELVMSMWVRWPGNEMNLLEGRFDQWSLEPQFNQYVWLDYRSPQPAEAERLADRWRHDPDIEIGLRMCDLRGTVQVTVPGPQLDGMEGDEIRKELSRINPLPSVEHWRNLEPEERPAVINRRLEWLESVPWDPVDRDSHTAEALGNAWERDLWTIDGRDIETGLVQLEPNPGGPSPYVELSSS